jgi:aryl-alcohol dehydrogenase-like predicted oxidoreductase
VQLRELGSTSLRVTPLGLGLAALGRPAYITTGRDTDLGGNRSVDAMERRCHEMLDAAYAAGICYVDTARSYGMAEAFLASWLNRRGLTRDVITIGSKWGYAYTGEWRMNADAHEVKDLSLGTLQRQIGESRTVLGERLALYQIHSATLESGVLDDKHVLAELARLHTDGLAIGLTVTGPRQADVIRRALTVTVDGVNPFHTVQATWNLLETSAGAALAEAHAQGWGVIVKEAVANGRLTDAYADANAKSLQQRAKAVGATLDAFAIAAALAQPWVSVVLSGAVTREQLQSNIAALDLASRVTNWSTAPESPDVYWSRRASRAWR